MGRMIRKQIVIDDEREATLARLAKERGVSQSELIRQAIDEMVEAAESREADEKRREEAHRWLMEYFEEGESLGLHDENGKRTWTRESLYGDRGFPRH